LKVLNLVLLIGSTAAIIAGTAIIWDVNRSVNSQYFNTIGATSAATTIEPPGRRRDAVVSVSGGSNSLQSSFQYQSISFVFALVLAWLAELSGEKFPHARFVLGAAFYGLFFYNHVRGPLNWQEMDDLRYAKAANLPGFSANSLVAAELIDSQSNVFVGLEYDNVKKYLAGGILNYGGLYLALLIVFGGLKFRFNLALFLYIGALACGIVGSVILFNLDGNTHSSTGPLDKTTAQFRALVFQEVAVPQLAILFILTGSVLFERVDGAISASVLTGLYGLWYLSYGFYLRIFTDSASSSQQGKAWAGSLFCWFSAWASILTAFLALRVAGEDGGVFKTPVVG